MARPLSVTEQARNATPLPGSVLRWSNATPSPLQEARQVAGDSIHSTRPTAEEDMNHLVEQARHLGLGGKPSPQLAPEELHELDLLRQENAQLRCLCGELEQALQEATQLNEPQSTDERIREYEALLDEKSEMIRQLHQEMQNAQSIVAELESQVQEVKQTRPPAGPTPREEELLALSEALEQDRRQLQEDEQTLMEQMREMEVSMARERAEMARQRNDLTRLLNEIRHELERLEKSGAAVRKMEELKRQFADATNRRGMAAGGHSQAPQSSSAQSPQQSAQQPKKDNSLMSRLFRGGK